ncbi:hypothetical protein BDV10DRAFT_182250 [Aspergillus recurvatus]
MKIQLGVRGKYSPAVRARSVWKFIGPVLAASPESIEEERVPQASDFNFQHEDTT